MVEFPALAASARPPDGLVGPLDDEVFRPRLVDRLDARWHVPIVLLVGPGGYGKSTAIAQAVRHNFIEARGVDAYVACRPTDQGASRLVARALGALEAPAAVVAAASEATADHVDLLAEAMSVFAPMPVCLALDDVHLLEPGSASADAVASLVRRLPTNGHLVLAGRTMPPLPLARFAAADAVVEIGTSDLAFDDDEAAALAESNAVDAEALRSAAGWPALTRLTATVGREASIDFLIEEVLDGLDGVTRRALAATVIAGTIDAGGLEEVAGLSDAGSLARVPLVVSGTDASMRAHDLWGDALERILEPDDLTEVGRAVAAWHLDGGRNDEALAAVATVGDWDTARSVVLAAIGSGEALEARSRTDGWLDVFPSDLRDCPELRLLRSAHLRHGGDIDAARTEASAALEQFVADDVIEGIVGATLESGLLAWRAGDVPAVLETVALAQHLVERGVDTLEWLVRLAPAGLADLQGDSAGALAILAETDVDRIPPPAAAIVLTWRATSTALLGDTGRAVELAEQVVDYVDDERSRAMGAMFRWEHGDVEPMLARRRFLHSPVGADAGGQDVFLVAYQALVASSVGIAVDLDPLAPPGPDRPREAALYAVAVAMSRVTAGDEDGAAAAIADLVERVGVDVPTARSVLRRVLPDVYPLSAVAREAIESDAEAGALGPRQVDRLRLARLFHGARTGAEVTWADLPAPADVLTGLPLRWSIELAARCPETQQTAGVDLAEYLLRTAGGAARSALTEMASGDDEVAALCRDLTGRLPVPPSVSARIRTCGELRVEGGGSVDGSLLRRKRVRQLVGLLVLRRRVRVDVALGLLWPDLEQDSARNNLRITASYVRRLLEPDRSSGQPSFHFRRRGEELWLEPSSHLDVDLWTMQDALHAGRTIEREGRIRDAVAAYDGAVALWDGPILADLRDHVDLGAELTHIDLELAAAAATMAEWAMAQGDFGVAVGAASRLLEHDAYDLRAHAVIIATHLDAGDVVLAGKAVDRCRTALDELDADPSPTLAVLFRRLERMVASAPLDAPTSA